MITLMTDILERSYQNLCFVTRSVDTWSRGAACDLREAR